MVAAVHVVTGERRLWVGAVVCEYTHQFIRVRRLQHAFVVGMGQRLLNEVVERCIMIHCTTTTTSSSSSSLRFDCLHEGLQPALAHLGVGGGDVVAQVLPVAVLRAPEPGEVTEVVVQFLHHIVVHGVPVHEVVAGLQPHPVPNIHFALADNHDIIVVTVIILAVATGVVVIVVLARILCTPRRR